MRLYRVKIYYREPEYELRAGRKPNPYSVIYNISAPSEENAIQDALSNFYNKAEHSSAHWYRKVLNVEAREIEEA